MKPEIYQESLEIELELRGIAYQAKPELRCHYKGRELNRGYFPDLFVFGGLVVELKAVTKLTTEHKAQVLEDETVLGRVVDYIHLNPVRAKVVAPEDAGSYRWSSLFRYLKGEEDPSMRAAEWLEARGGWKDGTRGRKAYAAHLVRIGRDEASWEKEGLAPMA